jgi:DNA-binding transcriptional LysR family regulator
MDLSVRLLRYFLAVAETGNFTRAAARLHVSQPALSQQIRKLERVVGTPLFKRGAQQVQLTPAGAELLEDARSVVAAAERFAQAADRVAGASLPLVVGFRAQAANELTTTLTARFRERRPDVELRLRQYPLSETLAGLDHEEVGLAFLRLPVDLTGLDCVPILSEPRVAVLPDQHALARRDEIELTDLAGLDRIVTSAPDPLWQEYARAGHDGGHEVVVDTVDEYLEAVSSGRAVGLAPRSAARFYGRPGIRYVPVRDAEHSIVVLAWREPSAQLSRTAGEFVSISQDQSALENR